ncbi:MAG: hypothetical protein Q9184_003117 [Pyrenodesmia sp. 2 TL-2023]
MASVSLNGMGYGPYLDSWFTRIHTETNGQHDRTSLKIDILTGRMAQYFLATQSKLKRRCNGLERKVDEIVNVDGKLDKLEEICSDIDSRLDGVESTIDDVEVVLDNRLDETEQTLGARFDELDNRFQALEKKMDLHFENMRALSHNGLCTQGWQLVKPVCKPDGQGRRILSPYLPDTVRDFWILKDLSQSETLVKLLQYYKVQGYEKWKSQHESAAEASRWSGENPGLAAAVQSHPDIAHRALAMELGLSYDTIRVSMKGNSSLHQARAPAPTTGASSPPSQSRKRRRAEPTESTHSPRMSTIPEFTQPVARRTRRKSAR